MTTPISNDAVQPVSGYVDSSGQAKLRNSIVAFLDILGFSQSIRVAADHGESQNLVDRILAAINDARQYVRQSLVGDFNSTPNLWALKFFSDNLVVGYPLEEGVSPASATQFIVRCAQRYQLRMVLNGFFLRGALTHGAICLTEDIIFGPALLECYQLESKTSIVPRVILSESLYRLLMTSLQRRSEGPDELSDSICRDIDGWWFVNYLDATVADGVVDWSMVQQHKQAILQTLVGVTRHDVLPKFGWACRYHNVFCHWHRAAQGYSDEFRIARDDENSIILRLGDVSATPPRQLEPMGTD